MQRSKTLCALVREKALPRDFSRLFLRELRETVDPQGNCFRILIVIVRDYRKRDFNPCAMAQIFRHGTTYSQEPALPRTSTRFQHPAEQDMVQDLVTGYFKRRFARETVIVWIAPHFPGVSQPLKFRIHPRRPQLYIATPDWSRHLIGDNRVNDVTGASVSQVKDHGVMHPADLLDFHIDFRDREIHRDADGVHFPKRCSKMSAVCLTHTISF